MNLESVMWQMASNAQAIRALVEAYPEHQARWKPDASSWSVLEVINHLLDEEREDFHAHIESVLYRPEEAWFRIDPEAWVSERGYNERDLEASLEGFMAAREESLQWLQGLQRAEWTVERKAPFGPIRAGDILAAWAAHDVLHLRQLVELKWAYLLQMVEPYGVRYAGAW